MSDILCRFATLKEHQSFSNGEITGGQFVFVYLRDGGGGVTYCSAIFVYYYQDLERLHSPGSPRILL